MSAGVREGLEWTVFDTPVTLAEVTAPTIVEDNTLKLYAKDKSGVSALFYKGDDEVEKDLSGGLTGSGTSGHVAFWTGATVLSGESNLFWDSTNNRLGIGTATPSDPLQVVGVGKFLGRLQLTGTTILPTTRGGVEMGHAEGTWGGFIETFGEGGTTYDRFTFKCNNWELNTGVVPAITLSVSAAGVVNVSNLTASQFVTTDASKNLVSNDHLGAVDPHTGYRLESADHSHQSTGLQAGTLDHGLALTGLSDDDHTQYALLAGRSGGQTIIGGTGTTDDLILRATAGIGASGSDIIFQVGNNGATQALKLFYDGGIGIGVGSLATTGTIRMGLSVSGFTWYIRNQADNVDNKFLEVSTGEIVKFFSTQALRFIAAGGVSGQLNIEGDGKISIGVEGLNTAIFNIRSSGNTAATYGFHLEDTTSAQLFDVRNDGMIAFGNAGMPTTGSKGLVFADGTALATMATNTAGLYADDIAGNVSMHAINENGDIIKLYKVATYTPTNVTTDRSFDADTVAIAELADVVGTLIADLQTLGFLG